MRLITFIGLLLLSFSISALFHIKYQVRSLKQDYAELNRLIRYEETTLHVLSAEWSYLNNPTRLEQLAQSHLHMSSPEIAQVRVFLHEANVTLVQNEKK